MPCHVMRAMQVPSSVCLSLCPPPPTHLVKLLKVLCVELVVNLRKESRLHLVQAVPGEAAEPRVVLIVGWGKRGCHRKGVVGRSGALKRWVALGERRERGGGGGAGGGRKGREGGSGWEGGAGWRSGTCSHTHSTHLDAVDAPGTQAVLHVTQQAADEVPGLPGCNAARTTQGVIHHTVRYTPHHTTPHHTTPQHTQTHALLTHPTHLDVADAPGAQAVLHVAQKAADKVPGLPGDDYLLGELEGQANDRSHGTLRQVVMGSSE
ncbi:unnamed protein product [Closterium sp. NIES-54]